MKVYVPLPHSKKPCYHHKVMKLLKGHTRVYDLQDATHMLTAELHIDHNIRGKGRAVYRNYHLRKI